MTPIAIGLVAFMSAIILAVIMTRRHRGNRRTGGDSSTGVWFTGDASSGKNGDGWGDSDGGSGDGGGGGGD